MLAASQAQALQTERFLDETVDDFSSGDLTTSTLTFDGKIMAPFQRERLSEVDASVVWDVAAKDGARYLATGHEGKLFRQQGNEAATVLKEFEDSALYTVDNLDGTIHVGASPSGKVYTIGDDGEAKEIAQTGAKAVWDLVSAGNALIAGTGPEGVVLKIKDDGSTTTLVKLPEVKNVLDLATIPESDDLLAATQGKGLVVRITPDGSFKVLLDPEQEEVRRVAVMKDGSILGAVNGVRSPEEKLLAGENGKKGNGTPQKPQPSSFIVRIHPDGFVQEWWTSPESPIHDFHVKDDDTIIVAAGNQGRLFVVTPSGDTNRAGITWEQYVTRLAPTEDGKLLVGTGATAALYSLDPSALGLGIFESRVLDGKTAVKWGMARLTTLDGGDGKILFSTRSGNTAEPDDSWSEWTEPSEPQDSGIAITAPVARFLQYRLTFPADGIDTANPPMVDMVRVFYARQNAAPKVSDVAVAPASPALVGRMQAAPHSAPAILEVNWKAEDPNQDVLFFDVYLRTHESEEWVLLEEDLDQPKALIFANLLPEGEYRAKVVARDGAANQGEGLESSAISNVFQIDNRQPDMILLEVTRRGAEEVLIRFRAEDQGSLIATAAWRADFEDWNRLEPEDDLMDEKSEIFSFTVTGKEASEGRFVTVVITDESGNTTVEKVPLVEKSNNGS
jgi:hypothetical protein